MESPTLEQFVLAWLEHHGALAEPIEPGVLQVLGGRAGSFPPEGEMATLVFDPEAIPEHPDAVPVFFGTPRADELLERGRGLAPVARAFRADLPASVHDLPARVRRALSASDAAIEVGPPRSRYDTLGLFLFRATFLGEEKEEELYAGGVDLALGRPRRGLDEWARSAALVDRRPLPLPDGPMAPLGKGLAIAWEEVGGRVRSAGHGREEATRARIAVERVRLVEYFEEELRRLDGRQAEAPAEEVASWESRRRATLAERDRRMAELQARLVLRVEVALASALLIVVPRAVAAFRLRTKDAQGDPVEVLYDLAEGAVIPPDCPGCLRPTVEWRLGPRRVGSPTHRVGCPACMERETRSLGRRTLS